MRPVWRLGGALVVTVAGLAACNRNPYGTEYVTKRPSRSDFVGRWTLDDQSRGLLEELGYQAPDSELKFLDRGRFVMRDAPACWFAFGEKRDFNSVSGTWKFERDAGCWDITLNTERINGREGFSVADLVIGRQGTEYVLYAIVGDPDEVQALCYRKAAEGEKESAF